ncbi:hypothetical protein HNR60_000006 [Rhodopseudomonas rhenobacensis]|uniref:DUF2125 domain-containing protein n=1 Tax=Rhodopseudomonas rhenobacensis TaxID=87461 RepID=A0A7W7YZR1_9BRAD|nr:DUF2125 domain-containing protein [Rhodopseudomonas rhenobacensis]MBB5045277.1 hypothetical protein [Rhodopseudomonas rhenobacensis]
MSEMLLTPRRRLWPVFVLPIVLLAAAAAWSGFWFYTAGRLDQSVDAWRAREAASGRAYDCGSRSVAGFPFRLEVRCKDASVALTSQAASPQQTPMIAKLGEILVVGQIYDPRLLIAEFAAPAVLAGPGQPPSLAVSWSVARASVVGLPGVPQRASIVFDDAAVDRLAGSAQTPLGRARHAELHGRLLDAMPPASRQLEAVLQLAGASLHDLHPLLAEPFDADVRAVLSGLQDFSPKPWPQRFRELQAAGGKVEISRARIQQGELVAVATGTLGLSPNGRLDGELQMTVAGIDKVVPALGIDKMLEQGVPQATLDRVAPGVRAKDVNSVLGALDRAIPGLGKAVRQNANAGVAVGINALGKDAVLEGRPARAFPLRFVDGAVFIGPLQVAQIPPLF